MKTCCSDCTDFLCGEVPDGDSGESADDGSCGALQRMPCDGRGCDAGLSAVNFEGRPKYEARAV